MYQVEKTMNDKYYSGNTEVTGVLEFYGGDKWRIDKGKEMSTCIQCLVEEELVQNYQRDLMPDEETRNALEYVEG